jgi:hypothetical protein
MDEKKFFLTMQNWGKRNLSEPIESYDVKRLHSHLEVLSEDFIKGTMDRFISMLGKLNLKKYNNRVPFNSKYHNKKDYDLPDWVFNPNWYIREARTIMFLLIDFTKRITKNENKNNLGNMAKQLDDGADIKNMMGDLLNVAKSIINKDNEIKQLKLRKINVFKQLCNHSLKNNYSSSCLIELFFKDFRDTFIKNILIRNRISISFVINELGKNFNYSLMSIRNGREIIFEPVDNSTKYLLYKNYSSYEGEPKEFLFSWMKYSAIDKQITL